MQDSCVAKTAAVCAELEEVTKIMDALQAQKKCIQTLVDEGQSASAVMKQELSKTRMTFFNVRDVDAQITTIEV